MNKIFSLTLLVAICVVIIGGKTINKSTREMVLIPAGEFLMGDDKGEDGSRPAHKVSLDSFLMDKYEVTQGDYKKLMGENPSEKYKSDKLHRFTKTELVGDNYPVTRVTWFDAVKYCNARSEAESLDPCYNEKTWKCDFRKNGYRLPTEAEWEYACRAGSNKKYYFGDDKEKLIEYANYWPKQLEHAKAMVDEKWDYKKNPLPTLMEVGQKKPNKFGLYDMLGNVSELCNDWYKFNYYKKSKKDNPLGPEKGDSKVVRGGGYLNGNALCSFRTERLLHSRSRLAGFRCVRKVPKEMLKKYNYSNNELNNLMKTLRKVYPKNEDRWMIAYKVGDLGAKAREALPELLEMLKNDENFTVRYCVMSALFDIGPEEKVVPHILNSMKNDPSYQVREHAARALREIENPSLEVISALAETLEKDSYYLARRDAAETLASFGPLAKAAVPTLIRAMKSDPQISGNLSSVEALEKIGTASEKVVPALISYLSFYSEKEKPRNSEKRICARACEALGNIKPVDGSVIPALISVLKSGDLLVQQNAAESLIKIGNQAIPLLKKAVKQDNEISTIWSACILLKISPETGEKMIPLLKEYIYSEDENLRSQAMQAVASARNSELATMVIKELEKELDVDKMNAAPVLSAVQELWEANPEEVIRVLTKAAGHPTNKGARYGAALSLSWLNLKDWNANKALPVIVEAYKYGETSEASWRCHPLRESVPDFVKLLNHESKLVRDEAMSQLAALDEKAKSAVPFLIVAVKDKKSPIRRIALSLLRYIGGKKADIISLSLDILKNEKDIDLKATAVECLGFCGKESKDAVPELIKILENPNLKEIHKEAIIALGAIGPEAAHAVPALIKKLQSIEPEEREEAIESLGKIGPSAKDAVPLLTNIMKFEYRDFKWHATISLIQIKTPPSEEEVVELLKQVDRKLWKGRIVGNIFHEINIAEKIPIKTLIKSFENKNPNFAVTSAFFLKELGPKAEEAIPALLKAMKSDDYKIRLSAVKVLNAVKPNSKEVEPVLISALKSDIEDEKDTAYEILLEMGPSGKFAVPEITPLLKDDDTIHRAAAILGKIGPAAEDAVPDLIYIACNDKDNYKRYAAITALGEIGHSCKEIVPSLLKILTDKNAPQRDEAIKALEKIGPVNDKIIPAIIESISDGNRKLYFEGANALGSFGAAAEAGIPVLIEITESDHPYYTLAAAQALGKIGKQPDNVIPALKKVYNSRHFGEVRRTAVIAMGKFGPDAAPAIPDLINALEDKDWAVQVAAAETLGKIGPDAKEAIPALEKAQKNELEDISKAATHAIKNIKR